MNYFADKKKDKELYLIIWIVWTIEYVKSIN